VQPPEQLDQDLEQDQQHDGHFQEPHPPVARDVEHELQRLADATGELIQLAVVNRDGMTYVAKAEGNQRVRVYSLLGQEASLHAST